MQQYLDLGRLIVEQGFDVYNERTGKHCRTVLNVDMVYDCTQHHLPLLTTRRLSARTCIAEMLGYLKGYDNAAQFRALGCSTWDANANLNKDWLKNPHRKGEDDMGRTYGSQCRDWQAPGGRRIDQLKDVYRDLKQGIDNRREIITFHNPGELDRTCLPACMHTHTFSLLDGHLYLTSYQRSCDVPLGLAFNMVQCAWFLMLMAHITGHKPGKVFHKIINAHIYEDQLPIMKEQHLTRRVQHAAPTLVINPDIKTLEDVTDWVTPDDFKIVGYESQGPIKYPFSV